LLGSLESLEEGGGAWLAVANAPVLLRSKTFKGVMCARWMWHMLLYKRLVTLNTPR
jgi:hypothetical protein